MCLFSLGEPSICSGPYDDLMCIYLEVIFHIFWINSKKSKINTRTQYIYIFPKSNPLLKEKYVHIWTLIYTFRKGVEVTASNQIRIDSLRIWRIKAASFLNKRTPFDYMSTAIPYRFSTLCLVYNFPTLCFFKTLWVSVEGVLDFQDLSPSQKQGRVSAPQRTSFVFRRSRELPNNQGFLWICSSLPMVTCLECCFFCLYWKNVQKLWRPWVHLDGQNKQLFWIGC